MGIQLSRRSFLSASGAFVLTATRGGVAVAQSTPSIAPTGEAPSLTDQVSAGSLPPVQERVPIDSLVVTPVESVGTYGGRWRSALIGGSDTPWLDKTIGYENLLRWDPEWTGVVPNIAQSYEATDDARSFTFTLRTGMKWSDGSPFTSADVEFYVNDVALNPDIGGVGSNPFTIEVADEQKFTITFEQPEGLFLQNLSTGVGNEWTRYPRHYLSQFHATYNTENLDELVQQAGAADWIELFRTKGAGIPGTPYSATWQNPELPHVRAWSVIEPYGDTPRVLCRRNPYYWKVDTAGNQLPYIDEVEYQVLQDAEVLLLKAASGEIDMHARHINTDANKAVLAEAQEAGQFHFIELISGLMNKVSIALNLTHKDPVTREIFQNLEFRKGLSHAINRQEIIDVVYVSQGEPWQLAPRPEAPFFNETLARQYTEYDIDLANQLLDSVLPNKDGDGMRLRSDGSKMTIIIEVASEGTVAPVDEVVLIADYWRAAGIDAQAQPVDRSLLYSRKDANDHDCAIWQGPGALTDAILDPRWYMPFSSESNFAEAWFGWYQKPANPTTAIEEPPEHVKQQFALYDQLQSTTNADEQYSIFADILAIAQQQFYAIGISLPANGYGIVKNNFHNVPSSFADANLFMTPGPTNPEQYFITPFAEG
ncbi:MAG: ABC transporter substrate-binding protein [Thermomicrobiales bacterium]